MLLIEDKRERYVVDKKNFKGNVQSILYGQKCPYSGKTEREYLSQGFVIYDSWDLFYDEMVNPYLLSLQGEWVEISEERYDDMLNCLPPMRWRNIASGINCFAMCEGLTYDLHSFYLQVTDGKSVKYYTAVRRIREKDSVIAADIINQLKLG
jgi:hypothetical protein